MPALQKFCQVVYWNGKMRSREISFFFFSLSLSHSLPSLSLQQKLYLIPCLRHQSKDILLYKQFGFSFFTVSTSSLSPIEFCLYSCKSSYYNYFSIKSKRAKLKFKNCTTKTTLNHSFSLPLEGVRKSFIFIKIHRLF